MLTLFEVCNLNIYNSLYLVTIIIIINIIIIHVTIIAVFTIFIAIIITFHRDR